MIKMIDTQGLLCPVIECDRCGELIVEIRRGAVVFAPNYGDYSGPIEFRHKGACFPLQEHRPWRELADFLQQLRNNVESDPRVP